MDFAVMGTEKKAKLADIKSEFRMARNMLANIPEASLGERIKHETVS